VTTIAVVGAGAAGIGAAYVLAGEYPVDVLDAGVRPGGHARTVRVGGLSIDTGFIVYNEDNYPRLTGLFAELGICTQPTVMSFSVECGCGVAWSSRRPWRAGPHLLREILRFLRSDPVPAGDTRTLAELLGDQGYSDSFLSHYLRPMTSALWSAPPGQALDMPASLALAFFENHGMLGLRRRRWRTVAGGSETYVAAVLRRGGVTARSEIDVRSVSRDDDGVALVDADGLERRYDSVVLAVSAPRALALLADPSDDERRLLGAFATTSNETVLHTDARFLPRLPGDRSAWNYQSPDCTAPGPLPTLTYSANRLQRLDAETEYCITLNRTADIDPARIVAVHDDEHPQMTLASHAAQHELPLLNGVRRTAFAGAWQGNGFHEDAFASGIRAAESLGRALA
jgi:predicted NAD/FAD-binding protein